ncbi:MAG: sigma-70 family RNA polymerase sigma factor [Bacteroidales bacterium]|nr:sigma-70 family RNA polymerase sigma factor [Bacteroidales bacterium]
MNFTDGDNDNVLVERVRNGDRMAMKRLYDRYSGFLASTCYRYISDNDEAKDVIQISFIKIFRAIGKFRPRGKGSLKAWMNKVAANESLKYLRNKRRLKIAGEVSEFPDVEDIPDVPDDLSTVPQAVIMGFIRDLPDGYRTVFNLYVFEEKSHREISHLLGISESTSASQLHRAKAMLAKRISDYIRNHE